jgi:hypothetical protein
MVLSLALNQPSACGIYQRLRRSLTAIGDWNNPDRGLWIYLTRALCDRLTGFSRAQAPLQ